MYYHRLLSQRAKSYMGALSTILVILSPLAIGLQEDQFVKLIACCHTVRELSFWVIKNGTYHRIVIINVHRMMSRHQDFLESKYLAVVCYSSTSPHMDTHSLGNPLVLTWQSRREPPFWCTCARHNHGHLHCLATPSAQTATKNIFLSHTIGIDW